MLAGAALAQSPFEAALAAEKTARPEEVLRLYGLAEQAAAGKPPELAVVRLCRGIYLSKQGRAAQAIVDLEAAAPFLTGAPPDVLSQLHLHLGIAYNGLERWAEAQRMLELALAPIRAQKRDDLLAKCLTELCSPCFHLALDDRKGLELALEGAAAALRSRSPAYRAEALSWAGAFSKRLVAPWDVVHYYRAASESWAAAGDVALSRSYAEMAAAVPGEVKAAIEMLEPGLEAPDLAPEKRAVLLHRLGNLYTFLEDRARAGQYLEEGAALYAQLGDDETADRMLVDRAALETDPLQAALLYERAHAPLEAARMFGQAGQTERGLALLEKTLAGLPDPLEQAEVRTCQAELERRRGNWDLASRVLEQALSLCPPGHPLLARVLNAQAELRQTLGDPRGSVELYQQALRLDRNPVTLSNLGTAYFDLGDFPRSLESLAEGRLLAEQDRNARILGVILNAQGRTYQFLGRSEQARELYMRALEQRRTARDRVGEAYTLNNLGAASEEAGRLEEALDFYDQALSVVQGTDERELEVVVQLNVATLMPDPAKRLPRFETTLALLRKLGRTDLEGATLHGMAFALADLDRGPEALEHYRRALELEREFEQPSTLSAMGVLLARMGRRAEAIEVLRRAVALLDELSAGLTSSARAGFLARNYDAYDLLLRLLLEEGDEAGAFSIAERSRARAFLDTLKHGRLPHREGVPLPLLEREQALRLELRSLLAGHSGARDPEVVKRELTSVLDEIRRYSPETAALREVTPPSLEALGRELGDQRVLLEYAAPLEGPCYVFILSRGGIRAVPLALTRAELKDRVDRARRLLLRQDPTTSAALEELGEVLLAPARPEIAAGRELVIAPADSLFYVPFSALRLDGQYLVDRVSLVQTPSASAWLTVRSRNRPAGKGVTLAALGNLQVDWADPLALPSDLREGFAPLPGTLTEVQAIAPMYPDPVVLKEREMSSEALARATRDARLVHLATHGQLDPRTPLFSGLVASDSMVTVSDLFEWDLRADLVVLSACQTGLVGLAGSQGDRGDDLVSLARAFQFAGSRSVLASLWKVSDEATAVGMIELHSRLGKGATPMAASRAAALKVREQYPEPFYWAPFVLMGAGD